MKRFFAPVAVLVLSLLVVLAPTNQALAQSQVSAERTVYAPFEPITVQWTGLPVQQNGWVGIGQPGQASFINTLSRSLSNFNGDVSDGKHTFPGVAPGTYEVRLALPPYGNETVIARATITVKEGGGQAAAPAGQVAAAPAAPAAAGGPTLTTDKPTYEQLEPIVVQWTNVALRNGWVGIGRPGGAAFDYGAREPFTSLPSDWQAKPASGTFTFPGRVAGTYEVRIVTGEIGSPQVLVRQLVTVKE